MAKTPVKDTRMLVLEDYQTAIPKEEKYLQL